MEIKLINTVVSQNYSQTDFCGLVNLRRVSNDLTVVTSDFANKYEVDINGQGTVYALTILHDGNTHIVGIIIVCPNDVRNKFKIEPTTEEELYHEFTLIVMDAKLFFPPFIKDCFKNVLKQEVNIEEGKKEVFWFDMQGELYAQIVKSNILKKYKEELSYYYEHQSDYFSNKIFGCMKSIEQKKLKFGIK